MTRRRVTLGSAGSQQYQYSAAEMERMMKIQEVLLQAMAKKITWWQAAEIIGVTDRTTSGCGGVSACPWSAKS